MKYLFFDIECAGVFKNVAKICAFGYCLVDEQFHIIEKEDVLINPKGGFHLTDRKGTRGLVLPYEYDKFKECPTFPEVADKIRALLEDEDTLVAGHATMNDVKYLNLETNRFSLPSFRFAFTDTQFLYMNKIGDFSRQYALGAIAENLHVEFTPHRAVDDAYATMKIAEAICLEEGLTLPQVLQKYGVTMGRIEGYEMTQTTSTRFREYQVELQKRREEREQRRAELHRHVDRERRNRNKSGALKGKRVCFSHRLEEALEEAKPLVTQAYGAGCVYAYKAEECDYYVACEGESGTRLKSAQAQKARIFTPAEFTEFIKKSGAGTD
jgi:DNA polymerase III epsilon subunit-like protein